MDFRKTFFVASRLAASGDAFRAGDVEVKLIVVLEYRKIVFSSG